MDTSIGKRWGGGSATNQLGTGAASFEIKTVEANRMEHPFRKRQSRTSSSAHRFILREAETGFEVPIPQADGLRTWPDMKGSTRKIGAIVGSTDENGIRLVDSAEEIFAALSGDEVKSVRTLVITLNLVLIGLTLFALFSMLQV